MPTGTSKVQIWNLALASVGQRPINSPDEQSVGALAIARVWDACRREVFRESGWGFATVIESLAEISNYTPPTGWSYGYMYPTNCLALRKVFPVDSTTASLVFPEAALAPNNFADSARSAAGEKFREIFYPPLNAKVILSNSKDAIAEYTYDVLDTLLYDSSVVTLIAMRVSADIATPLTGDASNAVNLMKLYNVRLSEAIRHNATEDNTRALGNPSILDSR